MELKSRHAVYLALGGGAVSLLLAVLSGQGVFAMLAGLFFLASLVLYRFGNVLVPWLLSRATIIQTRGPHQILDDAVVLATDERTLASCFLRVHVTQNPSSQEPDAVRAHALAFERMISSLRFPVKYSLLVYALDTEKYREDILVKRLEAEMAITRLKKDPKPSAAAVSREERRLSMHTRTLERLSCGEKPLDAEYLVMTCAQGSSPTDAIACAKRQARQLKAVVSNALGFPVSEVTGPDLPRVLDWEFMLPPTYDSFVDEA